MTLSHFKVTREFVKKTHFGIFSFWMPVLWVCSSCFCVIIYDMFCWDVTKKTNILCLFILVAAHCRTCVFWSSVSYCWSWMNLQREKEKNYFKKVIYSVHQTKKFSASAATYICIYTASACSSQCPHLQAHELYMLISFNFPASLHHVTLQKHAFSIWKGFLTPLKTHTSLWNDECVSGCEAIWLWVQAGFTILLFFFPGYYVSKIFQTLHDDNLHWALHFTVLVTVLVTVT